MRPAAFVVFSALGLCAPGLFAQTSRPAFEVASIRLSGPVPDGSVALGMHTDGAQVHAAFLSLRDYIAAAYRLRIYQISGPDWIESERFDVAATIPAGASRSQVPEMLQTLLEDRLGLKYHHESRELPVYALEVAKDGPKLTESKADPDAPGAPPPSPLNVTAQGSAKGVSINLGGGSSYSFADDHFEAKRLTIAAVAAGLERFLDRPVVDRTGLTANYDLTIEVTPEDYQAMLIRSAITAGVVLPPQARQIAERATSEALVEGLKKLGLKIERTQAPIDTIVIDSAHKIPTEN